MVENRRLHLETLSEPVTHSADTTPVLADYFEEELQLDEITDFSKYLNTYAEKRLQNKTHVDDTI